MTVAELCKKISLPEELAGRVAGFCAGFDFGDSRVQGAYSGLFDRDTREGAVAELQAVIGEDPDNIGILSCMLDCAVTKSLAWYRDRGIDETIFVDTMGCFSRFAGECFIRTGRYWFDREWWTSRQVGCHLFRIGALEYEIIERDGEIKKNLHIPSDANLTPESCDRSLDAAEKFFKIQYPEYDGCPWICNSWLLSPVLRDMLPEGSNILKFQNRFKITGESEPDMSFLEWVFHTKEENIDYGTLPEDTSLQWNLKKFLLSGGVTGSTPGVMLDR